MKNQLKKLAGTILMILIIAALTSCSTPYPLTHDSGVSVKPIQK